MTELTVFPTIEELASVPWEDAIGEMKLPTCSEIADILLKQANMSDEGGKKNEAKCYRFIGQLAFMQLEPNNEDAPLRPAIVMQTGRSAVPEDYDDGALATIEQLLACTKCSALRARFGDLLWIRKKDYKGAQEAAVHYLEAFRLVDSAGKWAWDIHGLERGCALARVLGRKKPLFEQYVSFAVGRLHAIEETCVDAYAARLLSLLIEHRAGDSANSNCKRNGCQVG